jgi:hypothetical protein
MPTSCAMLMDANAIDIPSEFDDLSLWLHQDVPDIISGQPRGAAAAG